MPKVWCRVPPARLLNPGGTLSLPTRLLAVLWFGPGRGRGWGWTRAPPALLGPASVVHGWSGARDVASCPPALHLPSHTPLHAHAYQPATYQPASLQNAPAAAGQQDGAAQRRGAGGGGHLAGGGADARGRRAAAGGWPPPPGGGGDLPRSCPATGRAGVRAAGCGEKGRACANTIDGTA